MKGFFSFPLLLMFFSFMLFILIIQSNNYNNLIDDSLMLLALRQEQSYVYLDVQTNEFMKSIEYNPITYQQTNFDFFAHDFKLPDLCRINKREYVYTNSLLLNVNANFEVICQINDFYVMNKYSYNKDVNTISYEVFDRDLI